MERWPPLSSVLYHAVFVDPAVIEEATTNTCAEYAGQGLIVAAGHKHLKLPNPQLGCLAFLSLGGS